MNTTMIKQPTVYQNKRVKEKPKDHFLKLLKKNKKPIGIWEKPNTVYSFNIQYFQHLLTTLAHDFFI